MIEQIIIREKSLKMFYRHFERKALSVSKKKFHYVMESGMTQN